MKHRRVISLLVVLCLVFSFVTPAFAADTNSTKASLDPDIRDKMLRVLSSIEAEKESYGMQDVDFSAVEIGLEIPSYRVSDGNLVETGLHIYPVLVNGEIVSLFWAAQDANGEWYVQLGTELVDEICATGVHENFSIVYDITGAYLYSEGGLLLLARADDSEVVSSSYTSSLSSAELASLNSSTFSTSTVLEHLTVDRDNLAQSYSTSALPNGVSLPVQIIKQPAETNICWAIVITSIANYIYKASWTYPEIVDMFTGGTDKKLFLHEVISYFNKYFSADYAYQYLTALDPDFVVERLYAGYPLFGSFYRIKDGEKMGHAVVIKGANYATYTFSVMNPTPTTTNYTSGTVSSSKVWTFISANSGELYTLEGVGYYSIG